MRLFLILALAIAATACADGAGDTDSINGDTSGAAAAGGANAATSGGQAGAAASATAQGSSVGGTQQPAAAASGDVPRVQVTMKEWAMEVSHDTVPAGTVIFDFVNGGTEEHELEVELGEREWEAGEVGPGGKGSMTTTLTPGTWIVYCPLSTPSANGSHKIKGQHTTIVVK